MTRMERAGLIIKTRSSEDKRTTYVRLTEAGFEKVDEIFMVGTQNLAGLFEGWPQQDLMEFRRLLTLVKISEEDPQELHCIRSAEKVK